MIFGLLCFQPVILVLRLPVTKLPVTTDFHQIKHLADSHKRWGDTSFLLGGWSGVVKDGDLSKWNPNLLMVSATIKFAEDTGRLSVKRDKDQEQEESESDDGNESEDGGEE